MLAFVDRVNLKMEYQYLLTKIISMYRVMNTRTITNASIDNEMTTPRSICDVITSTANLARFIISDFLQIATFAKYLLALIISL